VFSFTMFLSAALLFWVQLFTSKMILPILGGSAAVWMTCLVFFQIALLLGYLYARWLAHRSGRIHSYLHLALLLAAMAILALPQLPNDGNALHHPVITIFMTLTI